MAQRQDQIQEDLDLPYVHRRKSGSDRTVQFRANASEEDDSRAVANNVDLSSQP